MSDAVLLEMPGDSIYSFAPRVVAAWMVATSGAEIDAVEDARLAVDEIVAPFVAAGAPFEARLTEAAGSVLVEMTGSGPGPEVRLSPLAERILDVVAIDCEPLRDGRRGFRLELRSGPA